MNFESIYKNKRVFVTGHTGFKGSWLITWLNLLGANVTGYALAPEQEHDLYYAIDGNSLCHSIIGDIRDNAKLTASIVEHQPDFIFHLAAQPLVIESYNNPAYTHEVNAIGTANVLEAIRLLHKPCIAVMITTDKVYHNYETGQAYKEEDRLGGYDPYSASKAAAEIIIDSYRKSFFNPAKYAEHQKSISVARAGNVIGGGDWAKNRIIPDIVRALSTHQPVVVRNPNAVRPWQHVLEPLSGYLTLAAKQVENPVQFADAYNFGPHLQDNITVSKLAQQAIDSWGEGEITIPVTKEAVHEAGLLQLDISKSLNQLGWQPLLNSSNAIKQTIDWYKQVLLQHLPAREVTVQQIQSFISTGQ